MTPTNNTNTKAAQLGRPEVRLRSGFLDDASEITLALPPERTVAATAKSRLAIREIQPVSDTILHEGIKDLCRFKISFAHCIGLLNELNSLSLHQRIEPRFPIGAGRKLPVRRQLKRVIRRDPGGPTRRSLDVHYAAVRIDEIDFAEHFDAADLTVYVQFNCRRFDRGRRLLHVLRNENLANLGDLTRILVSIPEDLVGKLQTMAKKQRKTAEELLLEIVREYIEVQEFLQRKLSAKASQPKRPPKGL